MVLGACACSFNACIFPYTYLYTNTHLRESAKLIIVTWAWVSEWQLLVVIKFILLISFHNSISRYLIVVISEVGKCYSLGIISCKYVSFNGILSVELICFITYVCICNYPVKWRYFPCTSISWPLNIFTTQFVVPIFVQSLQNRLIIL